MHRLDEGLDISPLGLGAAQPLLRVPGVPLVPLALQLIGREPRPRPRLLHDAVDVALHGLLVEPVQAQPVRRRRPRRARLGDLLERVEGVHKDSVCPPALPLPSVSMRAVAAAPPFREHPPTESAMAATGPRPKGADAPAQGGRAESGGEAIVVQRPIATAARPEPPSAARARSGRAGAQAGSRLVCSAATRSGRRADEDKCRTNASVHARFGYVRFTVPKLN